MLVDINFFGQDAKQHWLELLPRDSKDTVSGSVLVNITWHYNSGVCKEVKKKRRKQGRIIKSKLNIDLKCFRVIE